MTCGDIVLTVEIGDRSRHFKNTMISTGGKSKRFHGAPEYRFTVAAEKAELFDRPWRHLRICVDSSELVKPPFLNIARFVDT